MNQSADHSEQSVLFSEIEILQAVLDGAEVGYWDWHLEEDYQYLSPKLKSMFGYKDDELANNPQSWQSIIYSEDLPKTLQKIEFHFNSEVEIPYESVVRVNHKNGRIMWVHCRGKVIEWNKAWYSIVS